MSEVLWWPEESWWERRSLPLLGFNLAPRQLLMLTFSGILGFVISSAVSAYLRVSLFGRIGALLFFLSIGLLFATKRVKMAPVEFQLYYRFVRKQGIIRSVAEARRIPQPKSLNAKSGINQRPLLLGMVAGCALATFSLSALASNVELKLTGEGLLVFVAMVGALSLGMDRKLRRVGRAEKANGIDKLFSGIVLSAVLSAVALHTSPLILIPEVASGYLMVRGILDIGRSRSWRKSSGVNAATTQ